jgi:cellulase/cellobiase CelA1
MADTTSSTTAATSPPVSLPPPPPPPPLQAPSQGERGRRSVLTYAAVGVTSLLIGVGVGAAVGRTETRTVAGDVPQEDLDELEARADELDAREAELDEREAALDAPDAGAAEPDATTDETAPAAEPDELYTAGHYEFTDVQVNEDFTGDFVMRTRVTNTGSAVETVSWTATLFSGGTVVATLNGFADGFDAGETVTVEFFGFDEYAGWDTIEFQVDFEV